MQRWAPAANVQVDLRLPAGTPFAITHAAAEQVADAAYAMNEQLPGESIDGVSVVAGNVVSPQTGTGESNGSHLAGVRLHLNERPTRQASPAEIERAWAREHRRAPAPGADAVPDHVRSDRAERRPTR